MRYRSLGRLDLQVSALGFGCMRLPTLGSSAEINEAEASRMLAYAIEHGVNYFDTAYGYHGQNSERFLGRFFKSNGYRDRVILATKLPCGEVHEHSDFDRLLNEQRAKLQTEHIDCYLLHGLRHERWEMVRALGVREWLHSAQADGRIGHLGFSFHDTIEAFKAIVDDFDWDFCQIQYNFMNESYQAGAEGLRYAASKGLGVVVMEPLLGGRLADPPDPVRALWEQAPVKRTAAQWGLLWVWNHPEVSLALSGMSTLEQVQENVATAEHAAPHVLTADELALIAQVRACYESLCPAPCTACEYCMPCPNGVHIPRNFGNLNRGVMYNWLQGAREAYSRLEEGQRASACIQCRECEPKCPQNILISEWMPYIHQVLGEGQPYEPRECPQP